MIRSQNAHLLAAKILKLLDDEAFIAYVTGHLRLGLDQTRYPYLIVTPPDRNRLRTIFHVVKETGKRLLVDDGGEVILIPTAIDNIGITDLIYTGPIGYVRYLQVWAKNLNMELRVDGFRPGVYWRENRLASRTEEAIFLTLGVPFDKRAIEFRKRFWEQDNRRGVD